MARTWGTQIYKMVRTLWSHFCERGDKTTGKNSVSTFALLEEPLSDLHLSPRQRVAPGRQSAQPAELAFDL